MRQKTLFFLWAACALVAVGIAALGLQIVTGSGNAGALLGVVPPVPLPALASREETWGTRQLQNLPNPLVAMKEDRAGASRLGEAAVLLGYDQIAEDQKTGTAYLLLRSRQLRVNAYLGEAILDFATGEEIPELAGWKLARLVPGAAVFRKGELEETLKLGGDSPLGPGGAGADGSLGSGDLVRQWAVTATASSQHTPESNSANMALGPPDNVPDTQKAWATQAPDSGEEWIELGYAIPVRPTGVRICETMHPGAVSKVEALRPDGSWQILWQGIDPEAGKQMAWFEVPFGPPEFKTSKIRVTLDLPRIPGYNEIDAVELIGQTNPEAAAPKKDSNAPANPPKAGRARRPR